MYHSCGRESLHLLSAMYSLSDSLTHGVTVAIDLLQEAARATVDSELYLAQLEELRGQAVTSPTSPEKHHIVVELAEEKAKVRRLRMEMYVSPYAIDVWVHRAPFVVDRAGTVC